MPGIRRLTRCRSASATSVKEAQRAACLSNTGRGLGVQPHHQQIFGGISRTAGSGPVIRYRCFRAKLAATSPSFTLRRRQPAHLSHSLLAFRVISRFDNIRGVTHVFARFCACHSPVLAARPMRLFHSAAERSRSSFMHGDELARQAVRASDGQTLFSLWSLG